MYSTNKQGVSYAVVGPGTIEITDPSADRSVLATVSRDAKGRQVVTVDTKSGFNIPPIC
jgi:hypothetical protein